MLTESNGSTVEFCRVLIMAATLLYRTFICSRWTWWDCRKQIRASRRSYLRRCFLFCWGFYLQLFLPQKLQILWNGTVASGFTGRSRKQPFCRKINCVSIHASILWLLEAAGYSPLFSSLTWCHWCAPCVNCLSPAWVNGSCRAMSKHSRRHVGARGVSGLRWFSREWL